MTPYYQDDHVMIYHGDCREILPTLTRADLVLTDPPYGLGERWQGGTWGAHPMYAEARRWDVLPSPDVLDAVLGSATNAIVWGGNYFALPPSRCWFAWVKVPAMQTMADFELAWTTYDRPCKSYTAPRNPDGQRLHPTQKPLGLMRWCLMESLHSTQVQTMVDPFMGSGTALRAAKDLGINGVGIDVSERYCEMAARRMAQEVLPL